MLEPGGLTGTKFVVENPANGVTSSELIDFVWGMLKLGGLMGMKFIVGNPADGAISSGLIVSGWGALKTARLTGMNFMSGKTAVGVTSSEVKSMVFEYMEDLGIKKLENSEIRRYKKIIFSYLLFCVLWTIIRGYFLSALVD